MQTAHRRLFILVLGLAALAGGGCQSPRHQPVFKRTEQERIRVNCYGLLHQLLRQQRNVDKLLLVKIESKELDRLITAIADASLAGADRLEEFSRKDPALPLDQVLLPPGEVAARGAIADTKKGLLLAPFNPEFETELLLTQAEALTYAWHLAQVAAENESNQQRATYLDRLAQQMKELHHHTMVLLRKSVRAARVVPERRPDNDHKLAGQDRISDP